jgi:hypothetical protein
VGIATSIILVAVGAILRFAVEPARHVAGTAVNWDIIGDILMAVGVVGLVMAVIWMTTTARRGSTIVEP